MMNVFEITPEQDAAIHKKLLGDGQPGFTPLERELIKQGQFLVDRLRDLEWSGDYETTEREYSGHAEPALERFCATLAKAKDRTYTCTCGYDDQLVRIGPDAVERVARAIDEACIAYSKSRAGLNLRKWDTPGEVMAIAAIAALKGEE